MHSISTIGVAEKNQTKVRAAEGLPTSPKAPSVRSTSSDEPAIIAKNASNIAKNPNENFMSGSIAYLEKYGDFC